MSKFIIECPVCHTYNEAKTGFFAHKKIRCTCGNTINVRTDKMVSRRCAGCGNDVIFDQSKGSKALCPICKTPLMTSESLQQYISFGCPTCGCNLQASRAAASVTCPVCDTTVDVQAQIKIYEQKKDGIPTVIKYEGDNLTFAWKHPVTDFVTGSQLVVHESQEAIFFRNGEALDAFGPGRYTLETGVLPKMDKMYHLPVQGQPFHAEVYFVNLVTQMNIKWGTPSKVGLFDPATGLHVELGASGSFNLRVTDARRLLIKLVGTTGSLSQAELFGDASTSVNAGYFRTMIATKVKGNLAKIIKAGRISVLELDEHVESISLALRDAINLELGEYGLEMPEFYVMNILTPDDDPNFRRMKQQHADLYLKTREEEIKKAEAEAAFERKSVEAQTAARMKVIGAQGDADAERIKAQAAADAYRMQAEAEAMEMKMKGYSYQQETARQVGMEAMKNGGAGNLSGFAGEAMQMGVGLGVMGGVIGMTREAVAPVTQQMGNMMQQAVTPDGWDCSCGRKNIVSKFCPDCGSKKPEPVADTWDCACGCKGIAGKFCPDCGSKRPEAPTPWDCTCGCKGIISKFCPECGSKRPEVWDCVCGNKGIKGKFCPECGTRKPE